jgi:hypothetical protein
LGTLEEKDRHASTATTDGKLRGFRQTTGRSPVGDGEQA